MNAAQTASSETKLGRLAAGDTSVLDALARMYEGNFESSQLDEETYQLVRVAALCAIDAPALSWLANLGVASATGVPAERVLGTLIAAAPITGVPRVLSAASNIVEALGIAEAEAEQE
jgi:hypothetical protein